MSQISIYDPKAIDSLRREVGLDPHAIRQLRNSLFKRGASDEIALEHLPGDSRDALRRRIEMHPLSLHRRCDSEIDGATKLLFRTQNGMLIESVVLRIATGRTTLCVSSQVGCAAACDFCATGKMGVAHDLTAPEIVDQVVQAGQLIAAEGRRIRNIVFMGMGEPFHNESHLHEAIRLLTSAEFLHHAPSRILVSTVGLPESMIRCARRFPAVNLALSLHSVDQATRERLIPLAKRYPLDELQASIQRLNRIQPGGTSVMIEYLMLNGVNDSIDDAASLVDWLRGLRVHVNLIPFNPIDDAPHLTGADRPTREAFAGVVKAGGFSTTIRYSLGADIAAACGQLVRRENRQLAARLATATLKS